jgi:hypothetical protein
MGSLHYSGSDAQANFSIDMDSETSGTVSLVDCTPAPKYACIFGRGETWKLMKAP